MYIQKEEILITIIVPVYNVREYLEECIKSIIHQSYRNLEIILVDDGSTDGSGEICDKYKNKDERIVVVHKENGGQSEARNIGLDIAKGSLIGFVDADDWINPDMFKILIENMLKYDADITVCGYALACDGKYSNKHFTGNDYVLDRVRALDQLLEDKKVKSFLCNKLFKRKLFEYNRLKVGKYYEDLLIMPKLFSESSKIAFVDEELYYYRYRENSTVNSNSVYNMFDMLEALEDRYNTYTEEYRRILIVNSMIDAVAKAKNCLYDSNIDKVEFKSCNEKINKYYKTYCFNAKVPIGKMLKGILYIYFPLIARFIRKCKMALKK